MEKKCNKDDNDSDIMIIRNIIILPYTSSPVYSSVSLLRKDKTQRGRCCLPED